MTATVTRIHGHERWLNKKELAEVLKVSESWINKRMVDVVDPMPFSRRGTRCKYRISEILAWEERRQAARLNQKGPS